MNVIFQRGPWKYAVKYEPDPVQPSVSLHVLSGSEWCRQVKQVLSVSWSPIVQTWALEGWSRDIPLEAVEAFLVEARRLLSGTSPQEGNTVQ